MRGRAGRLPLTVQERVAGVPSTLPATSVARTAKTCVPLPTSYDAGELHAASSPLWSRHSNVAPLSEAVKLKPAVVVVLGSAGPDVMVVSGATVSTVIVRRAGWEGFPATSRATAEIEWAPSDRPVRSVVQPPLPSAVSDAAVAVPSRTSTAMPGSAVPESVAVRELVTTSAAGAVMAGSAGGVVSMVSDRAVDGLESLPARSSTVAVIA